MKSVKVKYIGQGEDLVDGILIENLKDVNSYIKYLKKKESSIFRKFLKSGETPERLNHLVSGFESTERMIASFCCAYGSIKGSNPLYEIPNAINANMQTLVKMVACFGHAFINPYGGISRLGGDGIGSIKLVEVNDFEGFKESKNKSIRIAPESKVINLENDPYLEGDAVTYMTKRWGQNYSFIKELILFDKRELERIFSKFYNSGGRYVYVYTTGMNTEQMYEYSSAALKSGLKNFVFQFNLGINNDISDFCKWIESHSNLEVV